MRAPRLLIGTVMTALTFGAVAPAWAAPEYVARRITLPRGDLALDLGLGLGHLGRDGDSSVTGMGLNLEGAIGLLWNLELGFRSGARLDDHAGATRAAEFGRILQTETYGVNGDHFANPEVRLTWEVAYSSVAELALEWRVYLPTEDGSHFGFMFGLPLALHLGHVARIDSGIFVPVIPDHWSLVSVPLHVWFQVSSRLWLGPLTGVRWVHDGGTEVPFGFGLGCALARAVDLKTWLYFPDVNQTAGARNFGAGVGLQLRIE